MGIIQSRLQRNRETLIKQCETINQAIFFLDKLEKKTKQEIKLLESNKTKIHEGIQNMDLAIKKKKQEYRNVKNVLECSICMENKVDSVLIPCGHLYCSECAKVLEVCPHCRNSFGRIQRIFLN